jgi:hypothetical protein
MRRTSCVLHHAQARPETISEEVVMGRFRGLALAGVVALGTGACAPNLMGLGFQMTPACPVMQAHAYHTTSIMATRQRVQQIQAKYSLSHASTSIGSTSNAMVSGECR